MQLKGFCAIERGTATVAGPSVPVTGPSVLLTGLRFPLRWLVNCLIVGRSPQA